MIEKWKRTPENDAILIALRKYRVKMDNIEDNFGKRGYKNWAKTYIKEIIPDPDVREGFTNSKLANDNWKKEEYGGYKDIVFIKKGYLYSHKDDQLKALQDASKYNTQCLNRKNDELRHNLESTKNQVRDMQMVNDRQRKAHEIEMQKAVEYTKPYQDLEKHCNELEFDLKMKKEMISDLMDERNLYRAKYCKLENEIQNGVYTSFEPVEYSNLSEEFER